MQVFVRSPCLAVLAQDQVALRTKVISGGSLIAMMQSANLGERHDLALFRWLHPPRLRGILVQTQMCSAGVVVREITFKHAVQVSLVQHDDVIQTIAPN